jgi:hypothetical protein
MRADFPEHIIVTDVASGINFKRRGLLSILDRAYRGEVEEVVVAYRDRLARFASELIEWQLRTCGAKLVVQHQGMGTPESELVDDMLSIVTVFACRRNGRRRYKAADTAEAESVPGPRGATFPLRGLRFQVSDATDADEAPQTKTPPGDVRDEEDTRVSQCCGQNRTEEMDGDF